MKTVFGVTAAGIVVAVLLGLLATTQQRSVPARPTATAGVVAAAPEAGAGAAAQSARMAGGNAAAALPAADIVRRPEDVPPPITRTTRPLPPRAGRRHERARRSRHL